MKYIELFKNGFDSTITEKIKPENYPYVGYSLSEGLQLSMILEENQSGYQMVDLGLPSGLKWADRNVGAETPQDNGLYFSWGNVDGHAVDENGNVIDYLFDSATYATTSGSQYTGSTLDDEHDAATYNMGGDWRMPTSAEILELDRNTDQYYIGEDGNMVDKSELSTSIKLRSVCFVKKGEPFDYNNRSNFIEIPFAGNCYSSVFGEGLSCFVWSSSATSSTHASVLYLKSNGEIFPGNYSYSHFYGHSVRGVHL